MRTVRVWRFPFGHAHVRPGVWQFRQRGQLARTLVQYVHMQVGR